MEKVARIASETIAKANVALEAGASGYVLGWEKAALFVRWDKGAAPQVTDVFRASVYATRNHAPTVQLENGNKDIAHLITRKDALLAAKASAERTLKMIDEIAKEG